MIATISWRYFLGNHLLPLSHFMTDFIPVFICLTFITVLVIYFVYPETKGRSLEKLAELFGDPVVVHLTNATDEEKFEMDMHIKNDLIAEEGDFKHVETRS